jgi:hypothetical protein
LPAPRSSTARVDRYLKVQFSIFNLRMDWINRAFDDWITFDQI